MEPQIAAIFLAAIIIAGPSFGLQLRQHTLEKRKNSAVFDRDYKTAESLYYTCLAYSCLGLFIIAVAPSQEDTISQYVMLIVYIGTILSFGFFLNYLKKLTSFLK